MNTPTITRCLAALLAVTFTTSVAFARPQAAQNGTDLEKQYAAQAQALRKQILAAVPATDATNKSAYEDAIQAEYAAKDQVKAAEEEMKAINKWKGLVGHAKNHWIRKADRGIKAAKEKLAQAKTDAEREAAEKELKKWEENRQAGVDALKERSANWEKAKQRLPEVEKQLADAKQALADAQNDVLAAHKNLGLDSLLASDKLDEALARYAVITEATPQRLAAFARQSDTHRKLIDNMLADGGLLVQMAVADGAKEGRYGEAMKIYTQIQQVDPKPEEGILQRLALAIALEHAKPISQRNPKGATNAPEFIDPVARYQQYATAYLNGELDPYFKDQSVWNLRFVIFGHEPDETLVWGREMMRNYRPDHITTDNHRWRYVAAVRTEIRYGS
ncbi:MAG: hypothetical protein R3336_07670, partial [Phycisphaeraceae bacterium]|nr:hypothetical protein [Phycisphaeraceae bacterium]